MRDLRQTSLMPSRRKGESAEEYALRCYRYRATHVGDPVARRARAQVWREANPERVVEYNRAYKASHQAERRVLQDRHREAHSDRERAREVTQRAEQTGLLVKPERCSRCSALEEFAADGRSLLQKHHLDYSDPLGVEWLCWRCHAKENERASRREVPVTAAG